MGTKPLRPVPGKSKIKMPPSKEASFIGLYIRSSVREPSFEDLISRACMSAGFPSIVSGGKNTDIRQRMEIVLRGMPTDTAEKYRLELKRIALLEKIKQIKAAKLH